MGNGCTRISPSLIYVSEFYFRELKHKTRIFGTRTFSFPTHIPALLSRDFLNSRGTYVYSLLISIVKSTYKSPNSSQGPSWPWVHFPWEIRSDLSFPQRDLTDGQWQLGPHRRKAVPHLWRMVEESGGAEPHREVLSWHGHWLEFLPHTFAKICSVLNKPIHLVFSDKIPQTFHLFQGPWTKGNLR